MFIDFIGAYNTVYRSKLMSKLKIYGVRRNMLTWFGRFLAQRWVKVWWDKTESKYKLSKISHPYGAVSSTVLFNVYINEFPEHLNKIDGIKFSMFANDIVTWTSAKNNNKQQRNLENNMNHFLKVLNSWSTENNIINSKSKTMYKFFSL